MMGLGCWLTIMGMLNGSGSLMIVASVLGGRMLSPLVQIIAQWKMIVSAKDSYARLDALLDSVPPKPVGMQLPAPTGQLVVENLFVAAPGKGPTILKGLSFVLNAGESLALIGPSASGKTTLTRALVGIWGAQSGKVRLDGADIFQWPKESLGPYLGYLPQTVELFDGTVAENIARFGEVDMDKVQAASRLIGMDDLVQTLPVAMIPNCAATRHVHFHLHGDGPAVLTPPSISEWPDVAWTPNTEKSTRVNLDTLTPEEVASWKPGQTLLLNGKMLTGRDAAHKRIADMLAKGEKLPVDFKNRVIYYVGPVDPVRNEVVGPAGPTTATRMDKFTEMMLAETGLISMVGKAERGPVAIEAIKKHKSAYLMAVGGAAYLVSKAIKESKVVGFADLGMEAIYEFTIQDMPVTVAVDSTGTSVHNTGPKEWQAKIGKIPVAQA
jgi:tartrate/fumarate subfamily iron-sulfur-dependent hydro-lyase beta chain